jgi:hypothetical protein
MSSAQINMSPPNPKHNFGSGNPFRIVKTYIDDTNVNKLDDLIVQHNGAMTTIENKLHVIGETSGTTMTYYDRLQILNDDAPILYAYLIWFIENILKKDQLKPAYESRKGSNTGPYDHLRNYYYTAKILFEKIKQYTNEQDVFDSVTRDAKNQFIPSAENNQTNVERVAAKDKNDNISAKQHNTGKSVSSMITDLKTTIEIGGKKQIIDFDVQNFGGQGDCLFLTLLAYLKVYRDGDLQTILNNINTKYNLGHPYNGYYENITDDAQLLRFAIADYVVTNPERPSVSTNATSLTASFKKGQTFGERLKSDYSRGTGTTANENYLNQMTKISTYGTEIEIAGASQLFNINIYVVNTLGLSGDQTYVNDPKNQNTCFIFNYNKGHYVILWPVQSPRSGEVYPRPATTSREASRAIQQQPVFSRGPTSPPSAPPSAREKSIPSGVVVQVHEGSGKWDSGDCTAADIIFKPFIDTIDRLIDSGYTQIGISYSANQDQTMEMLTKYGFDKTSQKLTKPSILTSEIKPSDFTKLYGSGQGWVLACQKAVLSDPKYNKIVRIIPFSTMRHSGATADKTRQGRKDPDQTLLGSIDDCIQFATLFLEQPNSIILGWRGYKVDKIQTALDTQRLLNDDSITPQVSSTFFSMPMPMSSTSSPLPTTANFEKRGVTPLMRACANGHKEITLALLQNGADFKQIDEVRRL